MATPSTPSGASSARQYETKTHIIHLDPRISAAKLAEFVVADPSRQKTIIKNSKKSPKVITLPYMRVRPMLATAMEAKGLNAKTLTQKASQIKATPFTTQWQQDDNNRSADALERLAKLSPKIACAGSTMIHRPSSGWKKLLLSDVQVSVQPDLVFSFTHRGVSKVGGVLMTTGQGQELSLARKGPKYSVGDYLSTLLFHMLETRLASLGGPLHSRCYAVDIFRGDLYTAPASHKTMIKHLEVACETIALRWPTIDVDDAEDDEDDDLFPF